MKKSRQKGFTLIELLVVISIIGVLASITLVSLDNAKKKAQDSVRKSDMKQLEMALEMYRIDYGTFPSTGGGWWGVCVNGGSRGTTGASGYIPNLAPQYIAVLPIDPRNIKTGWSGYLYQSNGTDYKLLDHDIGPESFPSAGKTFYDPSRPTWSWAIYTPGGISW